MTFTMVWHPKNNHDSNSCVASRIGLQTKFMRDQQYPQRPQMANRAACVPVGQALARQAMRANYLGVQDYLLFVALRTDATSMRCRRSPAVGLRPSTNIKVTRNLTEFIGEQSFAGVVSSIVVPRSNKEFM